MLQASNISEVLLRMLDWDMQSCAFVCVLPVNLVAALTPHSLYQLTIIELNVW